MITEEMEIINKAVQDAFKTACIVSTYTDIELVSATNTLLLVMTPYMITTPEGAQALADQVFSNKQMRDLILTTQFQLFSHCPEINYFYADVVNHIANGLSRDDTNGYNVMPKVVGDALGNREFVMGILTNNKWLTVVLLIILNHEPLRSV